MVKPPRVIDILPLSEARAKYGISGDKDIVTCGWPPCPVFHKYAIVDAGDDRIAVCVYKYRRIYRVSPYKVLDETRGGEE